MLSRFRQDELKFYLGMLPKELCEYIDKFPINTEYVKLFIDKYKYNYVKKMWVKK